MTKETKFKTAMQMVIMDAIGKGHSDPNELAAYMESPTFESAVLNYVELLEKEF